MRSSWPLQGGQGNNKVVYIAHLHVSQFLAGRGGWGEPQVGYRIVDVPKNIVKYITGNNICMVNALIHTLICTEVNCLFASVYSHYLQLSCADIHTNMMILYTQ